MTPAEMALQALMSGLSEGHIEEMADYLLTLAPALHVILAQERDPQRSQQLQLDLLAEALDPQPQPDGVQRSPAIDAWLTRNHVRLISAAGAGKLALVPDAPPMQMLPVRVVAAVEAAGTISYRLDTPEECERVPVIGASHSGYRRLLPEDVLTHGAFQRAIKIATTQIRELTEQDVVTLGATFRDLEGREQRVEVGRFLCLGSQGERWTCSAKSMQDRVAISEPDADGFRQYRQRDPQPVLAAILTSPFTLSVHGDVWQSQEDGGVITWNGKMGDELQMRVITRAIFAETYRLVGAEVLDGH